MKFEKVLLTMALGILSSLIYDQVIKPKLNR